MKPDSPSTVIYATSKDPKLMSKFYKDISSFIQKRPANSSVQSYSELRITASSEMLKSLCNELQQYKNLFYNYYVCNSLNNSEKE